MRAVAILLLTLLSSFSGVAADEAEVDRRQALAAAREVMAAAGICTLITLDATGHPQARVMDPFPPDDDFIVWMGTNRSTRKVGQIEADPRVTLSCFDRDGIGYVTLMGQAELVDSLDQRARRFKPAWKDFYLDEHRGEDFLLIKLVPLRLEMISIAHGIASAPQGWEPYSLEFSRGDG